MRGRGFRTFLFFAYLVLGLYFLNVPFAFIDLPSVGDWIIFAGGILLIIGAFKFMRPGYSSYGGSYY